MFGKMKNKTMLKYQLNTIETLTLLLLLQPRSIIGQPGEQFMIFLPTNWSLDDVTRMSNFVCGKDALCNETSSSSVFQCPSESWTCSECSCDKTCFQYATCCFDMYATTKDLLTINLDVKCISSATKPSQFVRTHNYYMIKNCPPYYDASFSTQNLCEHPFDVEEHRPVQGILRGAEYTFRNRHCAECHGLQKADIVSSWTEDYECHGYIDFSSVTSLNDYIINAKRSDRCAVLFKPPSGSQVHICDHAWELNYRTTCIDGTSVALQSACENIYSPVTSTAYGRLGRRVVETFKNVFCAICNRNMISRSKLGICVHPGFSNVLPQPFSSVSNFRRAFPYHLTSDGELSGCGDRQVFDPQKNQCRSIYCPDGMLIFNHTCKDIITSAFGVGYRSLHSVIPTVGLRILTKLRARTAFVHNYILHLKLRSSNLKPARESYEIGYTYEEDGPYVIMKKLTVYYKLVIGVHSPRDLVEKRLLDMQKTPYYWYLDNDPNKVEISERHPLPIDEVLSRPTRDYAPVPSQNGTVNGFYIDVGRLGIGWWTEESYRVVNNLLTCPMILLDESEYSFFENSTLQVHASKALLQPDDYRLRNNTVFVCWPLRGYMDKTPKVPTTSKGDLVLDKEEAIQTIVFFSISLLCVVLTLAAYVLKPSLVNFRERNDIALLVWIFLAQLFFITTIKANVLKTPCIILGALNHYFLLSLFSWTSVCAIHVHRTFYHPTNINNPLYVVVGCLCPLVIVVVYVIINLGVSNWSEAGYGGSMCFLSSSLKLGIGFALPIVIILIINFTIFLAVVVRFKGSQQKLRNDLLMKKDTDVMHVHFRISLMLTIAWVFGFISVLTGVEILRFFFSILNCFTGIYIGVTFVLKGGGRKTTGSQRSYQTDSSNVWHSKSATNSSSVRDPSSHNDASYTSHL